MNDRPLRTARLTFRVTDEERQRLVERAEECGMTVSRYVRRTALGAVPKARPRRIDRQAVAQLAKLGNNLNQLARVANATGQLKALRRLAALVARIEHAVREISS